MIIDETLFWRRILADPADASAKLVYADWLEERGDLRSRLLRREWGKPRISFIDWTALDGCADLYLSKFPELRAVADEHQWNNEWRKSLLASLDGDVDPYWLAALDTIAHPFLPFFFWNNTGLQAYTAE